MAVNNQIVQVNATVNQAPQAPPFQQTGAFISIGGTTQSVSASTFCADEAAVTAILSTVGNNTELTHMAKTFFDQGGTIGVNVLELGLITVGVTSQIAALQTFQSSNPNVNYAYLVPANWDTQASAFNTMADNFASATGKCYFFGSVSEGNLATYTNKACVMMVSSPTAGATEFQTAALFESFLNNDPGIATPAAPMAFRFVFGVTPWVQSGPNVATIDSILSEYGNVIQTGAEGGISTSCIFKGTMMDGNQMMFWYAVDWIQIQAKLELANAIINGSNSTTPIYYNQFGINTLLTILQDLGQDGVSFGLLLSAVFSATGFAQFVTANPSDYAAGIYTGFSCVATPQLGFTSVTFNVEATNFAA